MRATAQQEDPGKLSRLLELIVLFMMLPVILAFVSVIQRGMLVIPVLLAVAIGCLWVLMRDSRFDRNLLVGWRLDWRWFYGLVLRLGIGGSVIILWILVSEPESFLWLPRYRPGLWVMIIILYPLLSVYPQELVFRAFFFHRYSSLFQHRELALWLVNAALFSLAHLLFWNWQAVLLTAIGGYVFAGNYGRTRSLLFVCIEHALWGILVFTIGLGRYFYGGSVASWIN